MGGPPPVGCCGRWPPVGAGAVHRRVRGYRPAVRPQDAGQPDAQGLPFLRRQAGPPVGGSRGSDRHPVRRSRPSGRHSPRHLLARLPAAGARPSLRARRLDRSAPRGSIPGPPRPGLGPPALLAGGWPGCATKAGTASGNPRAPSPAAPAARVSRPIPIVRRAGQRSRPCPRSG